MSNTNTPPDTDHDHPPSSRVMVGTFTIDQVASANLRTWRNQAGWTLRHTTDQLNAHGWTMLKGRPLAESTYRDLESVKPDPRTGTITRKWQAIDQLAVCQAFGKSLHQLLLPPHECVTDPCTPAGFDDHDPGPLPFHDYLGIAQRFTDAQEAGQLPYTGVTVHMDQATNPDHPDATIPVWVNRDRDQLALLLFGISAHGFDEVAGKDAFREQTDDAVATLQAVIDQSTALITAMRQAGDA